MKRALTITSITLTVSLACAFAQQSQTQTKDVMIYRALGGGDPQEIKYNVQMKVTGDDANVMFMGNEFVFEGRPVKGAPYSAQSVNETVQTLSDGNRIVRSSNSKVYRDSEGRTRRESDGRGMPAGGLFFHFEGPPVPEAAEAGAMMTAPGPGRQELSHAQIMINDPVAGLNYVIDPETRTARMMTVRTAEIQDPAVAAAVARVKQDAAAMGKGEVTISEPGKTVVIRMQHSTGDSSSTEPVTESLGTQIIEGVECEGTRTTFTIPAGQIGNDLPIVITSERWFSPNLQTVVLSKRHDPRFGDTTFKLTGIDLSEPPASLFQVPPDYTVVDMAAKMKALIKEAPRK